MIKLAQPKILNSKGEVIRLTAKEQYHADYCQRMVNERFGNSLGYEVSITTLTTIMKKISEQKFFELAPADYLPVRVGEGAWSSNLTTYRSFSAADEFETGIVDTGGQNSRLAMADAGVDALNIKVFNWAKSIGWSIMDLEIAAKSGNWDLVSAKEESRKKNWDLGIQRIAFLGANGQNASATGTCLGLLNQAGITINTTTIPQPISAMDPTELKAFVSAILNDYRANCNRTAWPTHFHIPESDYLGLVGQASATFPIKSTLELLEDALKVATRNSAFKVLPLAYADAAYHDEVASLSGKQVYTLMNYDEKSVRMDVPVDYTNTLANSIDNFGFQNAGYGQFTGVLAYRPLEMMYFQHDAT
jgi:hypothetical protein